MVNFCSKEENIFWKKRGFLKKTNFLKSSLNEKIRNECIRLESLLESKGKWMRYYEYVNSERKLARIENFMDYSSIMKDLSCNSELLSIVEHCLGCKPVLFKEKINFKYPNSGFFAPHQDAPAFNHLGAKYHITVMITIDHTTIENGCINMSYESYNNEILPIEDDGSIKKDILNKLKWESIKCKIGDIVIFDSYVPHFSDINKTSSSRRALFLTYTALDNDNYDIRDRYYKDKRKKFPPECERDDSFVYDDNARKYNLANPIK